MKFNWGYGILIFILMFMTFILTLVYKCSHQKVDLVNEKYYEMELNYQDKINSMNNVASLEKKLQIEYSKEKNTIDISYPGKMNHEELSGNINFFKPDNASLDFNIKVISDNSNVQSIPVSKIRKGKWKINVTWVSAGISYSQDENILIN
jgi:nitrogen fixation protein FixH